MRMLRVHFNNRYTSDHQWLRKPDKDVFIITVAFQSIPKRATNQFREALRKRFPWNLALVNNQMLACKWLNKTGTHNHLVHKQTLNHLTKLAQMIELCCEYLSIECIWLNVLIMSITHFRVNPHFTVAWMSRNSLLETSAISEV